MLVPQRRVVVTGMGVLAPNGHGLAEFETALREGRSGVRFIPRLRELNFACQVGAVPVGLESLMERYFSVEQRMSMKASVIPSACIPALDAWVDAGLEVPDPFDDRVDWDTGAVIGTGGGGADHACFLLPSVLAGKVRRLGATHAEQMMVSGASARLAGLLALGGIVTTNSSACATGVEAIVHGFNAIRDGRAKRMVCGAAEGCEVVNWASFDAMRVMAPNFNDAPEKASRPMSARACGFVPAAGGAALVLESLECARKRGARIHAELSGAYMNCGGHRNGGSMTASNPRAAQQCIRHAVTMAGIKPGEIDLINGHLTGTKADPLEIENWRAALELTPATLPKVNATKSLIGHALGAAGAIEVVGCLLQLEHGFIHGSANCEDLSPLIEPYAKSIVQRTVDIDLRWVAKTSFGFGDVNACVIFNKWET